MKGTRDAGNHPGQVWIGGGPRGAGDRRPGDRRRGGARARARGVDSCRRLDPHDRHAADHAARDRADEAEEPGSWNRYRRHRRSDRPECAEPPPWRRGVRLVLRRLRGVRKRSGGSADQEAGEPDLRAGGRGRRVRNHGPPAPSRRRPRSARAEGPRQRRVGWRWLVRRTDRQGIRCRGHGREQHEEPGAASLDRRRSRRRLHARRLQGRERALRRHPRQRGRPLDGRHAPRTRTRPGS